MDAYDLTRTVPTSNLIALGFVLILSVAIPIIVIRTSRVKYHGRWPYLFYGIVDFLIVELIVCTYLISLIVLIPGMSDLLKDQTPVYLFIHTMLLGTFGEIGAFFILKYSSREARYLGTPIMLGAGVAAARSIILILTNAFQTLVVCMSINETGLPTLAEAAGDNLADFMQTIEPLLSAPASGYLITGIDIPVTFVLYISLFLLLYAVIKEKLPTYYIAVVAGIRFIYELPTYFSAYDYLSPIMAETVAIAITAGTAFLTYNIITKNLPNDVEEMEIKTPFGGRSNQPQKPFPKFNQNINK